MRRKTLSPVFVAAILLAVTASILCLTFYMQTVNIKAIYGTDIRVAVYDVNEITDEVPKAVEARDYAGLMKMAAKLEAAKDAGLLHPEIDSARLEAAKAIYTYADAIEAGTNGEAAMALLAEDVTDANADLRLLVQHAISKLADTNIKKMDKAYFKAMSKGTKFYKELSILASQE